ncbi:hypothetical protein F0562_036228 [Nyssa sinensis]|uniref:Uncharacterized protein n=1 Tax=Nyssa sinensis TaxID=561372 RepID=A0A5J5AD42_9ASTE|nr:hypothetical protein F0562_036228 [Nyssa sinensis]
MSMARRLWADVCHAYQILRKGKLKDDNIIVFMYDDIAFSIYNPRPGVIINRPQGDDVYDGVPKDYTGNDTNVSNFFTVMLANKTAITGGSGKVLDSAPEDHIFIFFSDHGGPGVIGIRDDDLGMNSPLMWLRGENGNRGIQSLNFQGIGVTPWMQPRLDASVLGMQGDIYQAIAAATLQDMRVVDPSKHAPPFLLQFQQPQSVPNRPAGLVVAQMLQQSQPQLAFIQSVQESQVQVQHQPHLLQ